MDSISVILNGGYIVRVLTQCRFCKLSHFKQKNGDGHPLWTSLLSHFYKLFSIHHPLGPTCTGEQNLKKWTTLDLASGAGKYGQ